MIRISMRMMAIFMDLSMKMVTGLMTVLETLHYLFLIPMVMALKIIWIMIQIMTA